uniref:glutathione S-transferase N-terminal domain-containing protein n=1 Tax=Enterobacter soli TaxID=885040 RepID=UPI0015954B53
MITLCCRNNSTNVTQVLWTLEELDLPFKQIMAGLQDGGNKEAESLAMKPNGLGPLLRDDEKDLTPREPNTIVRYLAAQYGQSPPWVESPAKRAQGWLLYTSPSPTDHNRNRKPER